MKKHSYAKIIILLLLGLFVTKGLKYIQYLDNIQMSSFQSENKKNDDTVEDYYNKNSEIIKKYNVIESETIQNETQISQDITQRGFDINQTTCDYSIDGTYLGTQNISDSQEKHPMYETIYVSSNGDIWNVISINGYIIANPVSYNMNSDLNRQTILSESETIIGYDSENNIFYETIPEDSELIVKIVDVINAETLDALTEEKISEL